MMKKIFKRVLTVMLTAVMLLTAAPLSGFAGLDLPNLADLFTLKADVATYSGKCGNNLTWSLDTYTGVLTISGTGDMYNWSYSSRAPWHINCSSIKTVVIGDSVTSIGNWAFGYCESLTSVTIPDSVTSIGSCAFYDCTGLTSITIPDSVTSIGHAAFRGCAGLTSITIPSSVTSIDDEAFCGCTGLTSITIPDSVTSICDYAFRNCTGLTSITIPDSVTSIGEHAFYDCTGLTNVTIGSGVTSISSGVFSGCAGLISITIPDSVRIIRANAFASCTRLTSITISDSVMYIEKYAFYGCSGLKNITVDSNNTVYDSREKCNAIIETKTNTLIIGCQNTQIPYSVTSIGYAAFGGCASLTSITIPDSVTSIGESAFSGCRGLTSITIPDSVTKIDNFAFWCCYDLTSITIPDSVKIISEGMVGHCTSLTSITIPNSVTSIGKSAFYGCTGLTSVTIPDSVTSIGDYAFYNCTSLTSVTIPDSVTIIGEYAFSYCYSLTDVYYTGSEEEWHKISIGSDNECLTIATIRFNSYKSSNNSTKLTYTIDSIKILPKESDASIKVDVIGKDIPLSLSNVTATVGGNTYTQDEDKTITIPTSAVTGDITITKSGYNDYVIPKAVYDTFTTASLDRALDYSAYMTNSDGKGRPYISSVFGRVSGSRDSYVDLTKNSLKVTPGTSYDFYITALNTSSSASYAITQDDSHKIPPQSSGVFTLSDIGDKLINGKTAYVYVTSGGTRSDLVPIRLKVENEDENAFVKQLKSGTLALGGSDGLTIKVPESWVLIGGSELNIADFNFPVGVNITGNKVRVSVGFDLWNKTITESTSKCAVDPETQQQIDRNTYIKEQKSGVITDGMWKTVKDGIKDAEWSWKNATTNADKLKVKRNLADRYGLSIGDLSSSSKKTSGFNVSALGYIEGEIVGGKFVMTDFLISCSGSFTISYTHQMAVGYIGVEGGGKLTVSFNAARNVADTTVDFDLETGIQVTPTITPRAGLGWDGVACIGVYGTASMPMGLTFSFVDKALTGSIQIDGEIGYEAKLLIFKTGRKPLISGTVGPWTHTWKFGSNKALLLDSFVNTELFETERASDSGSLTLELTERQTPSGWLSGSPLRKTRAISIESGINIKNLQTGVFENSDAAIITCGDTTMAVWTADDPTRDDYNRLKLVYSVYDNSTDTWSEPKAVYDDGYMDASPSLATDGKNIYVAWQKFVKTFDSTNSTEIADVFDCAEIYAAKYDAQADAFVSATRITNDSVYDYTPSVVVKDGTANVFYATDSSNSLTSIDGNKISKYSGGNTTVIKSDLATINGLKSAVVDSEIQIAYSTDTDGNLETTNDIALFYGCDSFTQASSASDETQTAIMNFTYADIDGETKLLYSDGLNIYYESEGKAKAILDEGATVSGQINAVKSGDATNLFWLSSTQSGNELYTASYENGNWSDAVALTNRGNKFSNVALTYASNTLLGVANETLMTYDEETSSYTQGDTNFVSIRLNDFVDLKADSMEIIEYDRAEGEMTGINVSVLNNGNVSLDRLYFDITDSNGYSKTYYIDTELLPGKTELCLLPYEIPTNFADTTVSVKVYSESYTDINEDDNTVSYKPEDADLLASNLPVTYFKDGCIITTEIANYSFTNAQNVVTTVSFEEDGEEKGVNYIGTLDNDSLISVDFAYAFDELTFDENGIAKIYLTVTADNAQSTTLTYLVEKNETVCAHPVTESADDIAPTCTEEGQKAGVRCLGCGEYISGGEVIPATGHTDLNGDSKCDACGISALETLTPTENTTTVIDAFNGYIYGINPKIENPFDYFSVNSGYDCEISGSLTNSDGNPCYGTGSTFTVKSGETVVAKYSLIIFGDVNGDGWYDGMDAVTVSCIANGMLTKDQIGEAAYMAADCNHDGVVDEFDVALLNQAGVLLANVDQTKTQEELAADSDYVEYLSLIDQNPTIEEEPEKPEQDNGYIAKLIAFIETILKYIVTLVNKIW